METKKGLILGFFKSADNEKIDIEPTPSFQLIDLKTRGKLTELATSLSYCLKKGTSRLIYSLMDEYLGVCIANLGPMKAGINQLEGLDEKRENIRWAVGSAAKQLKDIGVTYIAVDACYNPEAAAEGAGLSIFTYNELKTKNKEKHQDIELQLYELDPPNDYLIKWKTGLIKAEGQNLVRKMMDMPANIMTPTKFCDMVAKLPIAIDVKINDKKWVESKNMGAFLSVAKGSDEPLKFLEIRYQNLDYESKPIILVGKGITFDSGGISLKPSNNMDKMRADMGGAACIVGTIYTIALLGEKANLIGFAPLCENMPGGKATKPGDVVKCMNGTTIQIDNTDAEGRLILADALAYAETFPHQAIIDVATLTGAMGVALGSSVTGVFTNCKHLWRLLEEAGMNTGDRMWRMPLLKHFSRQVTDAHLADINNKGKIPKGGACYAAAFLKEFIVTSHWAHLDIAGVMEADNEVPYLTKGMSGRPVRTLVEFLINYYQMPHPMISQH